MCLFKSLFFRKKKKKKTFLAVQIIYESFFHRKENNIWRYRWSSCLFFREKEKKPILTVQMYLWFFWRWICDPSGCLWFAVLTDTRIGRKCPSSFHFFYTLQFPLPLRVDEGVVQCVCEVVRTCRLGERNALTSEQKLMLIAFWVAIAR